MGTSTDKVAAPLSGSRRSGLRDASSVLVPRGGQIVSAGTGRMP